MQSKSFGQQPSTSLRSLNFSSFAALSTCTNNTIDNMNATNGVVTSYDSIRRPFDHLSKVIKVTVEKQINTHHWPLTRHAYMFI